MANGNVMRTAHYITGKTFTVDRKALFSDGSPLFVETWHMSNEDTSNMWKVCLEGTEAEDDDDNAMGIRLFKWVTLFFCVNISNYVHAKIKWRVHQESDEESDYIVEREVPWMTYVGGEPYCEERPVTSAMTRISRFELLQSITRLTVTICCTWRQDELDITKVRKGVDTDLDRGNPHLVMEKLKALHHSQKHCDVVFVVGEKEIPAHKAVLAAMSDVFEKMFDHDTVEKETGRIEVEDATPANFKRMLRCLYTTHEPNWEDSSDDDLLELTYLAHKYGLEVLQNQCTRRLVAVITVDNVFKMMKSAQALNLESVVSRALALIRNNKKVLSTEHWKKLCEEDSAYAIDLLTQLTEKFL